MYEFHIKTNFYFCYREKKKVPSSRGNIKVYKLTLNENVDKCLRKSFTYLGLSLLNKFSLTQTNRHLLCIHVIKTGALKKEFKYEYTRISNSHVNRAYIKLIRISIWKEPFFGSLVLPFLKKKKTKKIENALEKHGKIICICVLNTIFYIHSQSFQIN